MNPLRVPSGWTGEAKAFVRQVEEEREASEARINTKINSNIGSWKSWTPTLAWTGTPPSPVTTTARYCIIGKTLFFNVYIGSPDGNGATDLSVSLPKPPKGDCAVYSQQSVAGKYTSPACYASTSTGKLEFVASSFSTCTNGSACIIRISGQYEI